jgi:transposase
MDRKIFLIVDGHPTHKAKLVKKFIADNSDKIELFFLPPYSPELNPDELVWAHVKTRIGKAAVQNKAELTSVAIRALRSLQKMPRLVSSFFHNPTCSYASMRLC